MRRKVLLAATLAVTAGMLTSALPALAHRTKTRQGQGVVAQRSQGAVAQRSQGDDPFEVDITRCAELVPTAVATGPPRPVTLDVVVLVDGNPGVAPATVMATAGRAYRPLGITLRPSFRNVSLSGASASGLIQQARSRMGGRVPGNADVVLVLTDKDIQEDGVSSVVGMADCIGGVAFPNRAFAVAEVLSPSDDRIALGPVALARNLSAKIAAHELGHLLGAQHHYANCVEGIASSLTQLEVSPCTVMFNSVDLAALNFSTLNGLVVRGHAEAHAAP